MDHGLWLWPLPPPEPLLLAVAWPALGLEPAAVRSTARPSLLPLSEPSGLGPCGLIAER
jgi:hypothetical protein